MTSKIECPRIKSATVVKANTQDGYKIWKESVVIKLDNGKEYWLTTDDLDFLSFLKVITK